MDVEPDWSQDDCVTSLKAVLKWEIEHLLQRLADVGEETFLFTVDVKDGDTTEMGSPKGKGFLSMSDLQEIKTQFQTYCQEFSQTHRANSYHPAAKIPRMDTTSYPSIKLEVSSDDDFTGNSSYTEQMYTDSSIENRHYTARSRRKRTPKKMRPNNASGNSEIGDTMILKTFNSEKFDLEKQSENPDLTGSLFGNFNVKNSQSMDNIYNNQSECMESSCHSEDDCGMKSNALKLTEVMPISQTLATGSAKRTARKSMKSNFKIRNCSKSIANRPLLTEQSQSNFLGFKSDLNDSKEYANSLGGVTGVGGANSMGGVNSDESGDLLLPQTMIDDDGTMKIVMSQQVVNKDMSMDDSEIKPEPFQPLEIQPKLEAQDSEVNAKHPTQRKKHFKSAPHDEDPGETALLNSAKLSIGRYKCPLCNQTTRDRHDLKRHLRTHTKEKPYLCNMCGKRFTRKWDLENHYTRHNKGDQDKVNAKVKRLSRMKVSLDQSEELTYEKLVSKLLVEQNIDVKGMAGSRFQNHDSSFHSENENSFFENIESEEPNSGNIRIKEEPVDIHEDDSKSNTTNVKEETEIDADISAAATEKERDLDDSVVTIMNDAVSTEDSECVQGSDY